MNQTILATPFNSVGFQMNPSREECEKTLSTLSNKTVLAISILAAGYFKPPAAADYIGSLDNLYGVVAGASTARQAREFFTLFKEKLC